MSRRFFCFRSRETFSGRAVIFLIGYWSIGGWSFIYIVKNYVSLLKSVDCSRVEFGIYISFF